MGSVSAGVGLPPTTFGAFGLTLGMSGERGIIFGSWPSGSASRMSRPKWREQGGAEGLDECGKASACSDLSSPVLCAGVVDCCWGVIGWL